MLNSDAKLVLLVLGLVTIVFVALVVLRRLVLTPLRGIPGPFWAKVSPFWLWINDLRGTAPDTIDNLHREFGTPPLLRLVIFLFLAVLTQYDQVPLFESALAR